MVNGFNGATFIVIDALVEVQSATIGAEDAGVVEAVGFVQGSEGEGAGGGGDRASVGDFQRVTGIENPDKALPGDISVINEIAVGLPGENLTGSTIQQN